MESESKKTKFLQTRLAELERIIGQKQLEIDFQNKLIELSSAHIERINSTIKNQHLKHYDISHQGLLNTFLDKAVDAYNNLRYHLSIKISPAQFEHNLKKLKIEDRIILYIFTELKQFGGNKNLNQLNFEL